MTLLSVIAVPETGAYDGLSVTARLGEIEMSTIGKDVGVEVGISTVIGTKEGAKFGVELAPSVGDTVGILMFPPDGVFVELAVGDECGT